jgi:hypothetical protein
MPYGYVDPANAILVNGVPLWHEWIAAPGSGIYPGDVVEFDTNYCSDGEAKIKECTADSEKYLGVANQEPMYNRETVYDAGDPVMVMSGSIVVVLRLAANEDITCGDLLKPAASGEVAELDCEAGTSDVANNACLKFAQALKSYGTSTQMQFIIGRLYS